MNEKKKLSELNVLNRCVVYMKVDEIARRNGTSDELIELFLKFCGDRNNNVSNEIDRLHKAQAEAERERKDRAYIKELYDCIENGTRSKEYERRHAIG